MEGVFANRRDLGGTAAQVSLDADSIAFERLRGEDMLDLAGADAEGGCTERAMRDDVAIAADRRSPGQGEALLGSDGLGKL